MTRTDVLKGVYFARWGGIVALGLCAAAASQRGAALAAAACGVAFLALLLSGRVQAVFWSELLAGLHDLNRRDYRASKVHSERFLARLHDRPWLRYLIWLGAGSYSPSVEATALNNLGAAELGLGEIESARAHLNQSIATDPQCPLPYRNMGILVRLTESPEAARPWFDRAAALGLRGDWSDRVVQASQRNNAELTTTGTFSSRDVG